MTIADALSHCATSVQSASDTPALDAQVLLAHIVNKPRSWLFAHPETELTQKQADKFKQAITQIQANVPLPYILGHWEFYGLDFVLNPSVLIPRPETELLVEEALHWLQSHTDRRAAADIGTGSGCIAVAIAKHIPDLQVNARDISEKALAIARANAEMHNLVERIQFEKADLLESVEMPFDLICANLPYIPSATLHTLQVFGREPTLALDGGTDGLNSIRQLLLYVPNCLQPGGLLLLEIDSSQGIPALTLAQETFPDADVRLLPDLAGHDRLVRIEN